MYFPYISKIFKGITISRFIDQFMVPGRLRHPEKVFRAQTGGRVLLCTLLIRQNKFWNSRDLLEKTWKIAKKFAKLRFLNRLSYSTLLSYGLEITFIQLFDSYLIRKNNLQSILKVVTKRIVTSIWVNFYFGFWDLWSVLLLRDDLWTTT